jgi:hypothetical protein
MKIQTEQEMNALYDEIKHYANLKIIISDKIDTTHTLLWERINEEAIRKGNLNEVSHLQQGIKRISFNPLSSRVDLRITEIPYLYPSRKILEENPELTGPMTGNLANCYDPKDGTLLFHMRGGEDIASPFGFQAAAAGMGRFREDPAVTAKKELAEEAGIFYPIPLLHGHAIDCLPFMKAGKIPQPLFSFGFMSDLSRFPNMKDLEDITMFEVQTKEGIRDGEVEKQEAYHFTIHRDIAEEITGQLNDQNRFYGPIYQSTLNFIKILRDKYLE